MPGELPNVGVDIEGNFQTKTFGDPKKNIYVHFEYMASGRYSIIRQGPFSNSDVEEDKETTLEVVWTLYQHQPPSVSQLQETPPSMMSQESLSAVGRVMMEDISTADLIIKCGTEIFRAHKVVLCSRLVPHDSKYVPILSTHSCLEGLRSSKP